MLCALSRIDWATAVHCGSCAAVMWSLRCRSVMRFSTRSIGLAFAEPSVATGVAVAVLEAAKAGPARATAPRKVAAANRRVVGLMRRNIICPFVAEYFHARSVRGRAKTIAARYGA